MNPERTAPLVLTLVAEGGEQFRVPLTVAGAQGLVLLLLSDPRVAGELSPGLIEHYLESKAERLETTKKRDAAFLQEAGILL